MKNILFWVAIAALGVGIWNLIPQQKKVETSLIERIENSDYEISIMILSKDGEDFFEYSNKHDGIETKKGLEEKLDSIVGEKLYK